MPYILTILTALALLAAPSAARAGDSARGTGTSVIDQLLGTGASATDSNGDGRIDTADVVFERLPQAAYRINAGGTETVTDHLGRQWLPDGPFVNTGQAASTSQAIAGVPAEMQSIFQTERWDDAGGEEMTYSFFVSPGRYIVQLHFAEIFPGEVSPGTRVFGIQLENEVAMPNYDIRRYVPGFTATRRGFETTVLDGQLDITFLHVANNPKVSAIEVIPIHDEDAGLAVMARLNAGGPGFTDVFGRTWSPDTGFFNTGNMDASSEGIAGTSFPQLFQTGRWDPAGEPNMVYTFGSLAPGNYKLRMHFAEFAYDNAGARVFDVWAEDQRVFAGVDIAGRGGRNASVSMQSSFDVTDGALEVVFTNIAEATKVSGIELYRNSLIEPGPNPGSVDWGTVALGSSGGGRFITMRNPTSESFIMQRVSLVPTFGSARDFRILIGGNAYQGADTPAGYSLSETVQAGGSYLMQADYFPTLEGSHDVRVTFETTAGNFDAWLFGNGGAPSGHPYLRPVAVFDEASFVDWNLDNVARVAADASGSYSRNSNVQITATEWYDGTSLYSTSAMTQNDFPIGPRTVTLVVRGSDGSSASRDYTFNVSGPDNVEAAMAMYYVPGNGGASAILESLPASADFVELTQSLRVTANGSNVGNSQLTFPILVRLVGSVQVQFPGTYEFRGTGGNSRKIFINGGETTGPFTFGNERVFFDARFAVNSADRMPVALEWSYNGGEFTTVAGNLFHDEKAESPVINFMSEGGPATGGNAVAITGLGYFPPNEVSLIWGNQTLGSDVLTVEPRRITLNAPSGRGIVDVAVLTPRGRSNTMQYRYDSVGTVPVKFQLADIAGMNKPTTGEIGPDGRLYVANQNGQLAIYTLDGNNNVSATQFVGTLQGYPNPTILGLTFNPWDDPSNVHIYVAHSALYNDGGSCVTGFSTYTGQVTRLDGPNFTSVTPIITGLPTSNHDHGVNGMFFDHFGDLFVLVGGNTNAGIVACPIGDLPESPYSGALLRAFTSRPDFNGTIMYFHDGGGLEMNQKNAWNVNPGPDIDIEVFAPGLRNAYDMVLTTAGRIYATDNGPNPGFGAASCGPGCQTGDPYGDDELNLVEQGNYYGHPNHNRARSDARQYVYRSVYEGQNSAFTQALTSFPSSTNGLVEYRASTFNGAMRGELLAQKFKGETYRVGLSPDGRSVAYKQFLPVQLKALDVTTAPGGAIIGINWEESKINIARPIDDAATGLTVYDIFPWRAPTEGNRSFVIGGVNFGDLGNTKVSIGGVQAALTEVTPTRIKGTIPARNAAPAGLLDVAVSVGSTTVFLNSAFQYIGDTVADSGARATIEIETGGGIITSSTYSSNSFKITNNSSNGQKLTKAVVDLRTAIFPDMVYDPFASAGDTVGKPFTLDSNNTSGGVNANYLDPHAGGFDTLELNFSNCNPGQGIFYSIDVDPANIKGTAPPGPGESGSISGLELVGSTFTLHFSDGTIITAQPWRKPGSQTGSINVGKPLQPARPGIEVLGVGGLQAMTSVQDHTIRVSGTPGTQIALMQVEAALFIQGSGFEVEPFDANTALNVEEQFATIGEEQFVDFNVTLKKSHGAAGYNYISAVLKDSEGHNGSVSEVVVLQLN